MDRLNKEDRILWATITRTIKPLKGRKPEHIGAALQAEPGDDSDLSKMDPPLSPSVNHVFSKGKQAKPNHLDFPTRRKLSKGSIAIDGRLDLHGLTQGEAHLLLSSFLRRAHLEGRRYVLVITGKGSSYGSDGALQRAVPMWLATPSFRAMVSGYELAARNHGGTGALYIRLTRKEKTSRDTIR